MMAGCLLADHLDEQRTWVFLTEAGGSGRRLAKPGTETSEVWQLGVGLELTEGSQGKV